MSDIPKERMSNDSLFTHCGVDMFGPFKIKERRSELKRYGTLFTCVASRTVHIEVTDSLDASFEPLYCKTWKHQKTLV